MLTHTVPLAVLSAMYFLLAVFVLSRDPHRPQYRAFAAMTGALFLTSFGALARSLVADLTVVRIATFFVQVGLLGLPLAMHRFTNLFLGAEGHASRRLLRAIELTFPVLAAAVLVDLFTGAGWIATLAVGREGQRLERYGPAGVLMAGEVLLIFLVSAGRTLAAYPRASGLRRIQIQFYGFGFTVMMVMTGLMFALRLPLLAHLGGIVWYLCIAYAITRYRFLDIQVVIRLGAIYATVSVILLALYGGLVAGGTAAFGRVVSPASWVFPVVGMAAIALCFDPLRNRVQNVLDRAFFRQQFDIRRSLETYATSAARVMSVPDLRALLTGTLERTLVPRAVRLYVREEAETGGAAVFRAGGGGGVGEAAVLASDDPLVAWCRASRRPCVRAELAWTVEGRAPSAVPDADPDRRALDTLDRLDADVACLLIREDDLLGLLALGPKRSELPYRAGEVAFIGALAAQAAVTLQAIRLHEAARALEKDLHEADKFASLGAVASEIAHEIRNPLSVVKTYVQLLPQKQGDPRFLGRFQERVVPEITRVEGILSNLLDGASGRRTAFASVSLAEVAAATLDFFEEDLARRRIAAVRDWNGAAPALNGDAGQLRQVFQNLILNAIQAMPQGGRLRVGVRADGGVLRVEVADTGPGIPPDQLPLLFRPFATTKPAGTGLGLAISRRIVGEHGGTLQVESRAGEGSVFVIEFPVDGRGDGAGAQPDAPLRGERTPGA